ncbi:choice-of-anchor R domain-containing protein [Rariglobus hedericola]|uniref:PEP-CTERM sorting domain-containing protein n=1 Tax=Rariglobus hedericola TaxID=2597822 RepID=A0A556QJG5_9BACT|nr:choice-of-anchor R domain-containing protein [Rariglobus hedericola]TSJ76786.1 PEP-CTERM sorting domain-containing protein [Rariglobus hedericola]
MQTPRLTSSLLILAALCTLCVGSVRADIIFGNLAGYTNDGGQSGAGSQINAVNSGGSNMVTGKGIGFTMGLTSYSVTSLTLRLNNVNDNPGVDVPTVSIYTANAGTAGSGSAGQANTLVGTFTNPTLNAGTTAANYTFTPAASITLNASTRYLIIVRQLNFVTDTVQEFNWLNGNGTVAPTGVAGSGYAVFGGTSNPASWTSSSSQFNWFQIDGTVSAVPEPSTYAALAGIASLGLVLIRRSRRQRLS